MKIYVNSIHNQVHSLHDYFTNLKTLLKQLELQEANESRFINELIFVNSNSSIKLEKYLFRQTTSIYFCQ